MMAAFDSSPEPIRIAYVLNSFIRAGVEEHVLSLLRNVNRDRFRPFLFAPPRLIAAFGNDLNDLDVQVVPLHIRGLWDMASMYRFWRLIRQHAITIINTHMFQASFYYTPLALAARAPVRLETAHLLESWRLERWPRCIRRASFAVDRSIARMQHAFLAVSDSCKRNLIEVKGIPADKITVIANGRDLNGFTRQAGQSRRNDIRQRLGIAPSEFVFGTMARLEKQKNHEFLLRAVSRLAASRNGFRVVLVGDGASRPSLQDLASRLEIAHLVTFAGFQADVVGHYAAFDVHVLPSLYEGLPLALIEALAMETPIIATDVDGNNEVVRHGDNGLLVPLGDIDALCNALAYAIDNREVIGEMARHGRQHVTELFSLERQVRDTELLYERLLRKHGAGSPVRTDH